ncbi:MAG: class I SAM-dependent methyltransferase [Candidatus Zixiibacteriota bacterium]|nr:MAG: class I SAM-dependent methyltransferase [candidate division Zixibacteria bacterium]
MYLPPKHHVPALEDPIAYYYIPGFRSFFIKRLQMCLDLLPPGRINSLLDVGCGTGIIIPELSRRVGEVWAIDSQLQERSLLGLLRQEQVTAHVAAADLMQLPFRPDRFDAVLLISVLEHIADLAGAVREIIRVTRPGGVVVAGFPTKNALTDKLLGPSTGFHVSTHRQILDSLQTSLTGFRTVHFPPFVPRDYSLYVACRGTKPR